VASEKLNLKQILGCVDMNYKGAWKEFSDEEKKSVGFWILNRYVSSVSGSRAKQERAILRTNEYYNKHFNTIGVGKENGHQELMWQLLCMSGATGNIEFHKYIGFKKKSESNSKAIKILEEIYPNMKSDEVELLARTSTKKEIKQLAEEHGIENVKL
jgi:hypothetical protein